ncbi:MAG: hypothetical protein ACLF0G_18375 [Candidatus Brocadiia bacterium]
MNPPDAWRPDSLGYVRHWLVAGPKATPYRGPGGSDDAMRRAAADRALVPPPEPVRLGASGPFGEPWRFHAPGANPFVECSGFHALLEVLDLYAATELSAPAEARLPARLWAAGTADLWLDGRHLVRLDVPRYMYPEAQAIELPLRQGANRLRVRLQALGVRDTRMLFGLQVLEGAEGLAVRLPGPAELTARLAAAERWLESVRADGDDALTSERPVPCDAELRAGETAMVWPGGQCRVAFEPQGADRLALAVEVAGQRLERRLEIPSNRPASPAAAPTLVARGHEHLRRIAARRPGGKGGALGVLARRALGQRLDGDGAELEAAADFVAQRRDCADFVLAALLRLLALDLVAEPEGRLIEHAAREFRYWSDEPGTDAMCFGSENHRLLFHGCQLLAGRRLAGQSFPNTGRSGEEQAALGAARCTAWLDEVERHGFREFLSSSYVPITVAALMNLVDFSGDGALSRRAAALVDRVFETLALHAFDGVVLGPQGRVYRNVLAPEDSGTQALLAYATDEAVPATSGWVAFVATSPAYRPPDGLARRMRQPVATTYRENGVEIHLQKTARWLLTSLALPASFDGGDAERGAAPNARSRLRPGVRGYQQHLWQASLGRGCHVFVNHPGSSHDLGHARPGYWYGNGILPRTAQRGGRVSQVFAVPDEHPVAFTHAHWPSDAFDRQEVRGPWAFGARGGGAVGLWCSEPLVPHDEVLTGRELRAWGRRAAWLCVCGGLEGGFEAFVRSCLALRPHFEPASLELRLADGEGLAWHVAGGPRG